MNEAVMPQGVVHHGAAHRHLAANLHTVFLVFGNFCNQADAQKQSTRVFEEGTL